MKRTLGLATLAGLFLLPLTCRPQLINPAVYVTTAATKNTSLRSLDVTKTDNARNQWIFGSLGASSNNNDPGFLINNGDTTTFPDDLDVFVSKLDPSGNVLFTKTFGTDKLEFLNGFDLDPAGEGVLFFQGGGTTIVNGTTYPDGTHFVYRLDENGNIKWLRTFYGAVYIDSRSSNVAIADNGDVIVSGIILPLSAGTIPTADFGDTTIAKKATPQLFVIRYAAGDGAMDFHLFDVEENMDVMSIHKGINDEIWLNVGVFSATTCTIDGKQLDLQQAGGGVMVKVSGNAEIISLENYFLKSYFTRWIPQEDGTITAVAILGVGATEKATGNNINNTQYDYPTLVKLGADGKLLWKHFTSGSYHYLDVNPGSNDILLTNCVNLGNPAYFLYKSDGTLKQTHAIQSDYNRFSFTGNFDRDSAVYISGMVNSEVTVNGTHSIFGDIQTYGFFYAKMPYKVNTASTIDFRFCVPYSFHGIEITESGTYTVVIPNSYNGDSTITLNFTKIPTTYSSITTKNCISYTAPSGKIFYQTGTYQDTIRNVDGCDSVITIDLTIDDTEIQLLGTAVGCAGGAGAIYSSAICGTASTYWPLPLDAEGAAPVYTELLPYNGRLYGITSEGGSTNFGVIFSYDPVTEDYRTEYSFDDIAVGATPQGSLMLAANGKMYGYASSRKAFNFGGIFEFDPITKSCTRMTSFKIDKGWVGNGKLIDGGDGKLYGVTVIGGTNSMGTVISYVPGEATYTTVASFDGAAHGSYPMLGLSYTDAGDGFYALTSEGGANGKGAICKFDIAAGTLTKLADFTGANGSSPYGTLTRTEDGKFFGMTLKGGAADKGVIFEFDPVTYQISVKFAFTTDGPGALPYGNLIQGTNGLLYGFTSDGGNKDDGTLFSFDPATSSHKVLNDFYYQDMGSNPKGTPVLVDGRLYGACNYGGWQYRGTLFSHDISAEITAKKVDLEKPSNGAGPVGRLTLAPNGNYYGTTGRGGSANSGVVFSFDASTGTYTALKDFDGYNTGGSSNDGLLKTRSGKFFGVCGIGGNGGGTIFEYKIGGNQLVQRYSFTPSSAGYRPDCNMIECSNGLLYGTSSSGGSNNGGVIYSFDPVSYKYTKLHDFTNATGDYARGGLCEVQEGLLAGMTWKGGTSDLGVVYTYDIKSKTYEVIGSFDGTNGAAPYGSLMKASNGKVYGLTVGTFPDYDGNLFELDLKNKQIKHLLILPDYAKKPYCALMEASNGKLYGTGTNDYGSVFEIDLATLQTRELLEFTCTNGSYPSLGYLVERSDCNMSAIVEVTKGLCFEGKDAKAAVKITGGSWPYRYEWSGNKGFYDSTDSLEAGSYTVKVSDERGCAVEVPFTIDPAADPGLSFDKLPVFCKDDGAYTLTEGHPEGGTYSGTAVTGSTFSPSAAGVGTFTMIYSYEKDGCKYEQSQSVVVDECLGINTVNRELVQVFPNPATNRVVVILPEFNETTQVELFDVSGKKVLGRRLDNVRSIELGIDGLAPGVYNIKVSNSSLNYTTKLVINR